MIRIRAIPPFRVLRGIQYNLSRHASLLNTAFKRDALVVRRYAKTRLRRVPGSVKRPIKWTSEKQWRAFFATDGFGRGIPTRRTNEMVDSWDVRFTFVGDGAEVALTNDTDYWRFVVGDEQQGFHRNTGWYRVDDVIPDIQNFAASRFAETYLTASDPFAGVPNE